MTIPPGFDALRAGFSGDIVLPGDEEYQAAIHRWAENACKPAAAVLFVKTDEDVRGALDFAKDSKVDFAVRGGGHSSSGASSSDGGIVIDLSRYYNTVTVDPTAKVAYVGGGATWDDVNNASIEHGLATPGGTVGETGVGGLTLGGGLGFLSGLHGLVIDNVLGARVMLADGTVVECGPAYAGKREDAEAHHDLFWAIRGGGGNFGIVLSFTLQLHPQPAEVLSGLLFWPVPAAGEDDSVYNRVIQECEKFQLEPKRGQETLWVMFAGAKPPGRDFGVYLLVSPFYSGSEAEGRERFKGILDQKPIINTVKMMPYAQTAHILPTKHGFNRYQSPCNISAPLSSLAPAIVFTLRRHIAGKRLRGVQPLVMLELFDTAKIESVPSDAMAFHRRDWGGAFSGALAYGWETDQGAGNALGVAQNDREGEAGALAKADEMLVVRTMIRETADAVAGRVPGEGSGEMTYGNYISEAADPKTSKSVFGPNYARLQRAKAQYDPDNVFGKWFPIQPYSTPADPA